MLIDFFQPLSFEIRHRNHDEGTIQQPDEKVNLMKVFETRRDVLRSSL